MKIQIGCPEKSPQGGYRLTYLVTPEDVNPYVSQLMGAHPEALKLELGFKGVQVQGYQLITVEPDGSIVQEFSLAPDAAYELFGIFQKIENSQTE